MKSAAGAFVAGAALFALPFLQSGFGDGGAHGATVHMNHEPRHGGSLVMLGNHHIEFVERDATIEVYLSDSERRPLRPPFATVAFDSRTPDVLEWRGYRLVAMRPDGAATAEYRIGLVDAPPLTIRVPAFGVAALSLRN